MRYPHDWTCRNCRSLVRDNHNCPTCGYPRSWKCTQCGDVTINSKVCETCHYPFKQERKEKHVYESASKRNNALNFLFNVKDRVTSYTDRIPGKYVIIVVLTLILIIIFSLRAPYTNLAPSIDNITLDARLRGDASTLFVGAHDDETRISNVSARIQTPLGESITLTMAETPLGWVSQENIIFNQTGEWLVRVVVTYSAGGSRTSRMNQVILTPCENNDACAQSEQCVDNGCEAFSCQYCEETTDHACVALECCKTSQCADDEVCSNNTCEEVVCKACEFPEAHTCFTYACCSHEDCASNTWCIEGVCEFISCESNQIVVNGSCITPECVSNSDCKLFESCEQNECVRLNCDLCEYAANHACLSYECCTDTMCEDDLVCGEFHRCVEPAS